MLFVAYFYNRWSGSGIGCLGLTKLFRISFRLLKEKWVNIYIYMNIHLFVNLLISCINIINRNLFFKKNYLIYHSNSIPIIWKYIYLCFRVYWINTYMYFIIESKYDVCITVIFINCFKLVVLRNSYMSYWFIYYHSVHC